MKSPKTVVSSVIVFFAVALATAPAGTTSNLDLARQLNQAFVEVAERVSPSVVVISVVNQPGSFLDLTDEEGEGDPMDSIPPGFWRRFHRQFEEQPPEKPESQGSGIIVRKNGFILTNRHVIEDAEKIEVRLKDGRSFPATVRGIDPQSDLAVLKIDADSLPAARFADSAAVRVGEFAIAIGAPFNLDYSVTFGHVSAKSRSNIVPGDEGAAMDQDFVQTDANINPGNSGGPLVNIEGEVIGINTLIQGMRSGIGFAVPSNLAKEVSDQLIARGKFTRAWLGVGIVALKDDSEYGDLVPNLKDGVVVQSIVPGSPAAKSGLHPADIITAVDGKSVATSQQLRNEVRGKTVGHSVTLDLVRDGQAMQIKVKPVEYVDPEVAAVKSSNPSAETAPAGLGITVNAITPELAGQFGVTQTQGVIVTAVERNSPAARKGIKPGDLITGLRTFGNKSRSINSPAQFTDALKSADLKKGVILQLMTGDAARFEVLKPEGD